MDVFGEFVDALAETLDDHENSAQAFAARAYLRMVEHHVSLVGELVDRARGLPEEVADAPIAIFVEGIDDDPTMRSSSLASSASSTCGTPR